MVNLNVADYSIPLTISGISPLEWVGIVTIFTVAIFLLMFFIIFFINLLWKIGNSFNRYFNRKVGYERIEDFVTGDGWN